MAFRKGQWVKLTKELVLDGGNEKRGAVGIHIGPAMRVGDPKKKEPGKVSLGDGVQEVHMVDSVEGTTRRVLPIREDHLVAVTSRTDIPRKRLATYHKKWTPQP